MIPAVDWLAKRARLSPNRVALIEASTGRRIVYAEWNRRANQAAHALQALGLRKGELLAVLSTNRLEYLDLLFACQKTGVILQALNTRLTVPELQALLREIPPRALVYSGDLGEKAAALEEAVPLMIALDEPVRGTHRRWEEWVSRASDRPPAPILLTLEDPWVLCYTGGTTGLPKAAILTYGTITWNAVNTVMSWGLRPDDVAILNAPLFHTGGLNVFTTPLVHIGGASILCAAFDPDQVFDLLEREPVTLLFGVPTMFIRLQQHPRWGRADFSRCRIVISGGAPCPMPIFERFFEKGVPFKTGYGLTEAGPNNFWLPDEKTQRKPGSVGSPLFHIEVRVVRDGHDAEPGEVGELWIRGPHVIPGYWNRPEETAQTIVEGWLRTGDLAMSDEEGDFYIVGRIKDLIISGGENIYPAEVESVMLGHPDVVEAALIGVPDPEWGEVGRAIVVRRPGSTMTEAELLAYLRGRLASYKVPKSVVFVEELPKTGAGKVDKTALKRRFGG
ncbi:long-chain fatty acid--CoA ligase [Thermoflexus sp.]|uniref:acyl-CoA synthetase n=1 Tax=Thermoflexus sp. TaxID=1969742 RepID=UPI0035E43E54